MIAHDRRCGDAILSLATIGTKFDSSYQSSKFMGERNTLDHPCEIYSTVPLAYRRMGILTEQVHVQIVLERKS